MIYGDRSFNSEINLVVKLLAINFEIVVDISNFYIRIIIFDHFHELFLVQSGYFVCVEFGKHLIDYRLNIVFVFHIIGIFCFNLIIVFDVFTQCCFHLIFLNYSVLIDIIVCETLFFLLAMVTLFFDRLIRRDLLCGSDDRSQ